MAWKSTFLNVTLKTEGATGEGSQFLMPLKLVYNNNICFNEQKGILEHNGKDKTIKTSFELSFMF